MSRRKKIRNIREDLERRVGWIVIQTNERRKGEVSIGGVQVKHVRINVNITTLPESITKVDQTIKNTTQHTVAALEVIVPSTIPLSILIITYLITTRRKQIP
jgi:hypothetical protein